MLKITKYSKRENEFFLDYIPQIIKKVDWGFFSRSRYAPILNRNSRIADFIGNFGENFSYVIKNENLIQHNLPASIVDIVNYKLGGVTIFYAKNNNELKLLLDHFWSSRPWDKIIPMKPKEEKLNSLDLSDRQIYFESFLDGDMWIIQTERYSLKDLRAIAEKMNKKN